MTPLYMGERDNMLTDYPPFIIGNDFAESEQQPLEGLEQTKMEERERQRKEQEERERERSSNFNEYEHFLDGELD